MQWSDGECFISVSIRLYVVRPIGCWTFGGIELAHTMASRMWNNVRQIETWQAMRAWENMNAYECRVDCSNPLQASACVRPKGASPSQLNSTQLHLRRASERASGGGEVCQSRGLPDIGDFNCPYPVVSWVGVSSRADMAGRERGERATATAAD